MRIIRRIVGIAIFAGVGFYLFNLFIQNAGQNSGPRPFADGEHLGFIRDFVFDDETIYFDDAVWLTGKAGEDAAIAAGHCTEENRSECLPNDYFIKNELVGEERLRVAPGLRVFMQTWKMEETGEVVEREIAPYEFSKMINDPALHWHQLPYRITIENGVVTRVGEVYIP